MPMHKKTEKYFIQRIARKGIFMKKIVFESKLLPDGHLYCPDELAEKKDAQFKVIVTFKENVYEATNEEVELSASMMPLKIFSQKRN